MRLFFNESRLFYVNFSKKSPSLGNPKDSFTSISIAQIINQIAILGLFHKFLCRFHELNALIDVQMDELIVHL